MIKKIIDHPGFSVSAFPLENGYLVTMRQQNLKKRIIGVYPECLNETSILHLDNDFNLLSVNILNEERVGIPIFRSYTKGVEDCRLIDEGSFLCSSLDTNEHWKPEVCYCEFSNNKITKLLKLFIDGEQYTRIEKNWLFLKRENNNLLLLYWYNPFKIVSVDLDSGCGKIVKEYSIPNLNLNAHGGACIYLEAEDKYLVVIRNFVVNSYKFRNNQWLLLDNNFMLIGISNEFIFPVNSEFNYQMCMSLIIKSSENKRLLYAIVSIDETNNYIYEYDLNNVLNDINPI